MGPKNKIYGKISKERKNLMKKIALQNLKKNAEVVPAKKWIKKTNKEIKKYQTYNR